MGKLGKRLTIVILAVFASLLTVAATGFTTKAKAADINLDGETFEIADKVSLKLNEDGGMRWILKVSDNVYNDVKNTSGVEMGFVIAPKALMDKADGNYYGMAQKILIPIDIATGYRDTGTTDTDWYFNGCVVKMLDVNRKCDYTAAAYIKSGDEVVKQTAINAKSVNNFYNVANKSILYSDEDYSEKMLGLESYNWLGTEEFPIKVETADQYNSLVAKINAGRDFSAKIIEIGKSVDRSGATLKDGYTLPEGTRYVCDGDAHAYKDGRCVDCDKLQTVGVQYLKNPDKDEYYVADYTGLDKEVYVLSEYNGKPVTYIGHSAFADDNPDLKKVILPESVTDLGGSCFRNCEALEFVSMPGIKSLIYSVDGRPDGTKDCNNNFLNCVNLKYVIVGEGFTTNTQQFLVENAPATAILNFFVNGTNGNIVLEGNNNLWSGVTYLKGDASKCLQWNYNENGNIVHGAAAHNFVDGVCSACGKYGDELTKGVVYNYDENEDCYYVGDNKTLNVSVVTILATYNDGVHGEKDVKYVEFMAFSGNVNITKVILPESVDSLEGSVFFGCTELEYVSMIGITNLDYASPYGGERNNNFRECFNLKVVVVSNALSSNVGQFGCGATDTGNKKILDFYVFGSSGAPSLDYVTADANNLCSGNVYYYSENEKAGYWSYDENGNAVLW